MEHAHQAKIYKIFNKESNSVEWKMVYGDDSDVNNIHFFTTIEKLIAHYESKGFSIDNIAFIWNGDEMMDNVVNITRKDNSNISYQGKVIEKYDTYCKAIIITERGNEVWECHNDFWDIEHGVKIFKT